MRKPSKRTHLPFLDCLWFLSVEITEKNYQEIVRRLAELAPRYQVIGECDKEGWTPVKRVIFADERLYETDFILTERPITARRRLPDFLEIERLPGPHSDLTRLRNFQVKLKQVMDLLYAKRFSGAALIVSEFIKHVGVEFCGYELKETKRGVLVKERPFVLLTTQPFADVYIWWQLGLMAMRQDWQDYIGRCPIEGCANRYFLKSRTDQKFCSPRHRVLYKVRELRGQDPATGQRKPRRELLTD